MHLGVSAIELIKSLPRMVGSSLVFASASGGDTPISLFKVWNDICAAANLEDLRIHDLRHNFASLAVSSGQSLYLVGRLLGHSQAQTTQRYAHLARDPLRDAANNVANMIGRNMGYEKDK